MRTVKAGYEIIDDLDGIAILKKIEKIGRVCYKSEDKITSESCKPFVEGLIRSGHHSVIEHFSFSVKFIVDRAIQLEIVRHRLCSYSASSTRYVNYAKDKFGKSIDFIIPCFLDIPEMSEEEIDHIKSSGKYSWEIIEDSFPDKEWVWLDTMARAEKTYMYAVSDLGMTAQEARDLLPHSIKSELICSTNLREWRHILKLRTAKTAHPQMREVMIPLLKELKTKIPVIFDDIEISE